MRKRDILFLRARKSNSNTNWSNFMKLRNSVAKSIISSHKNYINNIIGMILYIDIQGTLSKIQNVSGHMLD